MLMGKFETGSVSMNNFTWSDYFGIVQIQTVLLVAVQLF